MICPNCQHRVSMPVERPQVACGRFTPGEDVPTCAPQPPEGCGKLIHWTKKYCEECAAKHDRCEQCGGPMPAICSGPGFDRPFEDPPKE